MLRETIKYVGILIMASNLTIALIPTNTYTDRSTEKKSGIAFEYYTPRPSPSFDDLDLRYVDLQKDIDESYAKRTKK